LDIIPEEDTRIFYGLPYFLNHDGQLEHGNNSLALYTFWCPAQPIANCIPGY